MIKNDHNSSCLLYRGAQDLYIETLKICNPIDLTRAGFDKASFIQHIDRESSLAHSFFSSSGINPVHLRNKLTFQRSDHADLFSTALNKTRFYWQASTFLQVFHLKIPLKKKTDENPAL
jgi:hypothetical protein